MLKRFLPRQDGFFTFFQKSADILVLAATKFHTLFLESDNQQKNVDAIANYEEEGDTVAHATFALLHKTFITPFDRHDIHILTSRLDDILDLINRCAQRFPFYQLTNIPKELIELAALCVQCTELLKKAIGQLQTLDKSDEILKSCEAIDALESRAHQIVLIGEKDLFLHEQDFKTFFKFKDTYARTKEVINSCQDVANIIKGIVLEYS
jgi:uncharacterized protein